MSFNNRGGQRDGSGRKKIKNEQLKRNKQWRLSVNEEELLILNKQFDSKKKHELVQNLIKRGGKMNVIAILNQKGGIGKTTSVRNIGEIFKSLGKKVLLIDMDQQGNLTTSFGIDKTNLEYTIHNLLLSIANKDYSLDVKDVLIDVEGIHLIPSNIKLARADFNFGNVRGREYMLNEILKEVEFNYDYCLIDCPPNLGIITDNALVASNSIYVPMKAEKFALEGITDLLDTVDDIKSYYNPKLEIAGVFLNQLKKRTNLHEFLTDEIKEYFGDKLLKSTIRDSIKIAEASAMNLAVTAYAPDSSGAEDFTSLVNEILEREEA